jgi:hypothetical protein
MGNPKTMREQEQMGIRLSKPSLLVWLVAWPLALLNSWGSKLKVQNPITSDEINDDACSSNPDF